MALRVFEAANQSDAMAAMASAMGPDALIVTAQETNGRFRLTAALPQDETDLSLLLAPPPPSQLDQTLQWVIDFHRPTKPVVERLRSAVSSAPSDGPVQLSRRLAEFVQFEPLGSGRSASPGVAAPKSKLKTDRPLALVGLPGSGKTACCARLALASRLAGQVPQIVSLDRQKTGGTHQLSELLGAMGLSLSPDLQQPCHEQPAIIDTAGVNPYSVKDMATIAKQLDQLGAEPILVFDAVFDAADAADMASAFRAIGIKRAIVTRLDLCRRLGSVLSLAASGMALSGAAVSPMIAKPVLPLSMIGLERLFLRHRP